MHGKATRKSGEPRGTFKAATGRRMRVVKCAACGRLIYAACALYHNDSGYRHNDDECRPIWWKCRTRYRVGTEGWRVSDTFGKLVSENERSTRTLYAHCGMTYKLKQRP